MVRMMNDEFKIMNWKSVQTIVAIVALSFTIHNSKLLFGQQPQAPAGSPLYSANAKYVNGMAPGYWATAGSGLTLNVSAGTAYCGNPPAPVSYPGGSLTLTASATNFVYLDPANNCAPAASTSAFTAGEVPIATVVAGPSSITSITDARTWFTPQPCVTGSGGSLNCSSGGTNQNITLTPSGGGASVITNLQDKGGQVFNVKAYGAKGDGATNDSPAFQAAYNAAVAAGMGTVLIPQTTSCYLLNTPINMTNTNASQAVDTGITIRGASGGQHGVINSTAPICGNTGGIVFDLTGSQEIVFDNVHVTSQSGVTNPSLIGLYIARNSSGWGAQHITVRDSSFMMVMHTSGTTYSFGAYLYGSESDFFVNSMFAGDYPLMVSTSNAFNQHSAFVTEATGNRSETDDEFLKLELETKGLGPAAYFNGTANMTLTGHVWNFSHANPYPSGLYNYALQFEGGNNSVYVRFRQEGYPGFAHIKYGFMDSTLFGTNAPAGSPPLHAVEFNDASSVIAGDRFEINDEYSTPSANYYYDSNEAATTGVSVLDGVYFYCGAETNCVNIPVGNYAGSHPNYWSKVTWAGGSNNQYPVISINHPVTGTFSIPATAVAATSCTTLASQAAATTGANSAVQIAPQGWYNLMILPNPSNGSFTPRICNPTSSSITPSATTARWEVKQ